MSILLNVKNDNLVELKKYLQSNSLNVVDDDNKGLLHYAALGCANVCMNILLDNGANIEHTDNLGQTAIFDAAVKGNLGILKILIRKGANCNVKDIYGNLPLFYAIKTNNRAVVDILFDNTNLNITNNKLEDALLFAIKFNYRDIKKFINNELIVNDNGDSIMHYAVKYNNFNLVKEFANRFNVNQKNHDGETPFFYAVRYSNRDIIRYLLKFLPIIDVKNKFSENLLDFVNENHYLIDDLIENYLSSLDFVYYKQNNAHIYNYLCNSIVTKINPILQNKKDNFSLSLLDYVMFNNDKASLKLLKK